MSSLPEAGLGSVLRGRAHRYGDNVNTDVIIPARYLNTSDVGELAAHCLEDLDAGFVEKVRPGDLIVGGENFGCGSSREQAALAIKAAGVSCVIAASFARIFFRNAINIGLPVLVCAEAAREARAGDEMVVDLAAGRIENLAQGSSYQAEPFPEFLRRIVAAGGLVPYTRARLASR
jgi:3-isopropylmalate/(R)-2-methylmalate dehydratase small subunit